MNMDDHEAMDNGKEVHPQKVVPIVLGECDHTKTEIIEYKQVTGNKARVMVSQNGDFVLRVEPDWSGRCLDSARQSFIDKEFAEFLAEKIISHIGTKQESEGLPEKLEYLQEYLDRVRNQFLNDVDGLEYSVTESMPGWKIDRNTWRIVHE